MQSDNRFEVNHPRLDAPFSFGCTGDLDTVGHTVRVHGLASYERPVTNIIVEIARNGSGIILDVGANTGLYTLAAAAANRSAKVIAFEPLESIRNLLKSNIAMNDGLVPRIAIEPVGLSNESGTYKFYETINDRGFVSTSSSFEQSHIEQVGGEHIEHVIRTVTLDDFGETLGGQPVSFMKIDVEGHEHAVISGGRRFISRHRPIITVEVLGTAETNPINNMMLEADYISFAMAPDALRQCEGVRFFPDAWNHLLVPVEKLGLILSLCRCLGLRLELH